MAATRKGRPYNYISSSPLGYMIGGCTYPLCELFSENILQLKPTKISRSSEAFAHILDYGPIHRSLTANVVSLPALEGHER